MPLQFQESHPTPQVPHQHPLNPQIEGGTTLVATLDLARRMEEAFYTVLSEDPVEVPRRGSKNENTEKSEGTGLLQLRDPMPSATIEGYKEVCSEAIPTNVHKRTVEIVKSAALDLKLVTKDYEVLETKKLRSDITSIVTV